MKMKYWKGCVPVLAFSLIAGCNPGTPRPQISFRPEIVQFGNVIVEAEVDPNGTTISEIRIEWGRRPSSEHAVSVAATDFFGNNDLRSLGTSQVIQLPSDDPFSARFNFGFPSGGHPLQEGEIVDYQIRVTHSNPNGGTLFHWSQRQSFTYNSDDVPGGVVNPPIGGGGGGTSECSQDTVWVSIHTGGGSIQNGGGAKTPSISEDGKIIAFASPVAFDSNDVNNADDIYIHDREEEETVLVSVFTGSGSINNTGGAKTPAVSADGDSIAFVTPAAFDSNDVNNSDDIYVHDRGDNKTTRISVHTGGGSINNSGGAKSPSISGDGNVIAFVTPVGFDSNDNNNADDIYIHGRTVNETRRISIHTGGGSIANNGGAKEPAISKDGKVIAFVTPVGFDSNDTNDADDVYVHDLNTNQTVWVSVHTGGGSIENSGGAKSPAISADGNLVAFVTPAGFETDDDNSADDVYVHDRGANQTARVSIHTGPGSIANNGGAKNPAVSGDGSVVAFVTPVNFDSDDVNNADDVYIHCR